MPISQNDLIILIGIAGGLGYYLWKNYTKPAPTPTPSPSTPSPPQVDEWSSLREKVDSKVNQIKETKKKEEQAETKALFRSLEEKL